MLLYISLQQISLIMFKFSFMVNVCCQLFFQPKIILLMFLNKILIIFL